MIERGLGYHLQRRKSGFFAKRNTKGFVPPDGHWRFIVLCAELAQNKLHISDIEVNWIELHNALVEAKLYNIARSVKQDYYFGVRANYNAHDILNLKTIFGL